jgi:hypothetical protein
LFKRFVRLVVDDFRDDIGTGHTPVAEKKSKGLNVFDDDGPEKFVGESFKLSPANSSANENILRKIKFQLNLLTI